MVAGTLLRHVPLPWPRTRTLSRYFGMRFLTTAILVFIGILSLVALVDYIEMMRKTAGMPNVPASIVAQTSLFRVPQIAERIMPFSVLIAAMSCYLNLSRRLELVVARAAGMSAWQFVDAGPADRARARRARDPRLQSDGGRPAGALAAASRSRSSAAAPESGLQSTGNGFWVRQKNADGQSIINAADQQRAGRPARRRDRIHVRRRTATSSSGSRPRPRCSSRTRGG